MEESLRVNKCMAYHDKGYSCSQSVFLAFCDLYGIDEKLGSKISSPFGGGIGDSGGICGTITAIILLIGLEYGREYPDDEEKRILTAKISREILERFRKQFGKTDCIDLLGRDISTESKREKVLKNNEFAICEQYIKYAAQIAEEYLINK